MITPMNCSTCRYRVSGICCQPRSVKIAEKVEDEEMCRYWEGQDEAD